MAEGKGKTDHKFTLALNKKVDENELLEIASRLAIGVSSIAPENLGDRMQFLEFVDGDDERHSFVSALSLIVMRGKAGELRKFRGSASAGNLLCVDITRSVWEADHGNIEGHLGKDKEPEYLAVMVFGEKGAINPITGRLSLWR